MATNKDITQEQFKLIPKKEKIYLGVDFDSEVVGQGKPQANATNNEVSFSFEGDLIKDIINERLDSQSKNILSDFDFGTVDYAGALKAGDISWDVNTGGSVTGSGVAIYRKGMVGANAGTVTFSIDATTGNATFRGEITASVMTASEINGSTITGGTVRTNDTTTRIEMNGNDNAFYVYNSGDIVAKMDSSGMGVASSGGFYVYDSGGTTIGSITDTAFGFGFESETGYGITLNSDSDVNIESANGAVEISVGGFNNIIVAESTQVTLQKDTLLIGSLYSTSNNLYLNSPTGSLGGNQFSPESITFVTGINFTAETFTTDSKTVLVQQ